MRFVTLYNDRFGKKFSLHYIRTIDGTEVDFLICKSNQPWLLIEVKESKTDISHGLKRFTAELGIPGLLVIKKSNIAYRKDNISVISWSKLAGLLP